MGQWICLLSHWQMSAECCGTNTHQSLHGWQQLLGQSKMAKVIGTCDTQISSLPSSLCPAHLSRNCEAKPAKTHRNRFNIDAAYDVTQHAGSSTDCQRITYCMPLAYLHLKAVLSVALAGRP